MRILIDECIPREFKFDLFHHGQVCSTVQEAGYAGKRNGELLELADRNFDVLVTVDKNVRYQQSLAGKRISILTIRAKSIVLLIYDYVWLIALRPCNLLNQPRSLRFSQSISLSTWPIVALLTVYHSRLCGNAQHRRPS